MHTEMYKRDMAVRQKAKDDALIAKGITPPDSIATKSDDDLSEAQKVEKADMIKLIETNKKRLEDKDKEYWDKVNGDGEEWTHLMPMKFLSGPQSPAPGPDKPEPTAPATPKEGEAAAAPAEGAAVAPAAPAVAAAPAAEAAPVAPPA